MTRPADLCSIVPVDETERSKLVKRLLLDVPLRPLKLNRAVPRARAGVALDTAPAEGLPSLLLPDKR